MQAAYQHFLEALLGLPGIALLQVGIGQAVHSLRALGVDLVKAV
jgi:hypothetical protein